MNILNYCAGYDTGGYSIRLKQAFDRHSTHTYRSCIGRPVSYIRYPTDANHREARRLQAWADLIHVSHQPLPITKPQLVQYHGTKFRNSPDKFLALQKNANARAVVSTLDLWLMAPDQTEWLPTPYDLDWLASFRRPIADGILRVGHAPTARAIKSTQPFLSALLRLSQDVDVSLVLVEKQDWLTCLKAKGTVDVYFDQVILGYGNNAVEAWGMGIPVIAGAQPETLAEMRRRFGTLPFYEATEDTIYEALVAMANPLNRQYMATRGAEHVAEYHADHRVVRHLETVYEDMMS